MKTKEEISAKIKDLNDKIEGIKSEDESNLTNELKVILAGSELQSIMLKSILTSSETEIRELAKRFESRGNDLNKKYEEASKDNDVTIKNKIHAMIWTNDIRIDTLKWVLEEEDNEI